MGRKHHRAVSIRQPDEWDGADEQFRWRFRDHFGCLHPAMNTHLLLLVSAWGLSPLLCAPPADIARGTLVDKQGRSIGSYAVRDAGSAAIPEFPYIIRVEVARASPVPRNGTMSCAR